jgi:hypothetical protein
MPSNIVVFMNPTAGNCEPVFFLANMSSFYFFIKFCVLIASVSDASLFLHMMLQTVPCRLCLQWNQCKGMLDTFQFLPILYLKMQTLCIENVISC